MKNSRLLLAHNLSRRDRSFLPILESLLFVAILESSTNGPRAFYNVAFRLRLKRKSLGALQRGGAIIGGGAIIRAEHERLLLASVVVALHPGTPGGDVGINVP